MTPGDMVSNAGLGQGKMGSMLAPLVAGIVSSIQECGIKDEIVQFAQKRALKSIEEHSAVISSQGEKCVPRKPSCPCLHMTEHPAQDISEYTGSCDVTYPAYLLLTQNVLSHEQKLSERQLLCLLCQTHPDLALLNAVPVPQAWEHGCGGHHQRSQSPRRPDCCSCGGDDLPRCAASRRLRL